MTFTLRVRGRGGLIAAEYICPHHGRFALDVQRDANGDPPSLVLCPVKVDEDKAIVCGATSEWAISAPLGRVALCSFTRGKNNDAPPNAANTHLLAEGMPYHEWRASHEKRLRDIDRAEWKQRTGL
jgi:hypothetical protein